VPDSVTWLSDVDSNTGKNYRDGKRHRRQRQTGFWPFDRDQKTSESQNRHEIESHNGFFSSVHMLIKRLSTSVITHAARSFVRPLSAHKDWVGRNPGDKRKDKRRDLCSAAPEH